MVGGQWCRFTFIDFLLGDIIVDGVSHNDGLFEALLYSTLALALLRDVLFIGISSFVKEDDRRDEKSLGKVSSEVVSCSSNTSEKYP
jgi:hypothetical protein